MRFFTTFDLERNICNVCTIVKCTLKTTKEYGKQKSFKERD
jgi:hypothetical protein